MLARRDSIGASDVAAIVGIDRWRTAADVFDSLMRRSKEKPPESRPAEDVVAELNGDQLRGILDEDHAAQLYSIRSGLNMRRIQTQAHPSIGMLHANCDRQVLAGVDIDGVEWETHPAEIKVPRPQVFDRVKEYGVDAWYLVQGQVQLSCFPRYPYMRFIIMNPITKETLGVVVQRREKLIASLEDAVCRFVRDHVEPGVRPTDFEVDLPELPELGGEVEVWEDDRAVAFAEAWAKVHLIRQVGKQAEKVGKQAAAEWGSRMGSIKKVEVPGYGKFTHVVVQPRDEVDGKAVLAYCEREDIDPAEAGLLKQRAGYSYVLPTFDKGKLNELRGAATDLVCNGLENTSVKALEEGNDDDE